MKKSLPVCFALLTLLATAGNAMSGKKPATPVLSSEWTYLVEQPRTFYFDTSPAIADINGDGFLESVFGTGEWNGSWGYGGRYICLGPSGNHLFDVVTSDDFTGASAAVADIDLDGNKEIIGGSCSGYNLFSWDGPTGAMEWSFGGYGIDEFGNYYSYGSFKPSPAVAEVRSDYPGREVLTVDEGGNILALSAKGALIWKQQPLRPEGFPDMFLASAPLADVDGDGRIELVAVSIYGAIYIYDAATGALERTFGITEEIGQFPIYQYDDYNQICYAGWVWGAVVSSPAIANVDNDARPEIIFGSVGGNLYTFDGLTGYQTAVPVGGPILSSPAVGDVDADGVLEIVVGSGDNNVYCLNRFGGMEWSFAAGGPVNSSPALFNRANTTRLAAEWPFFRHDLNRTGYYGNRRINLAVFVGSDDGFVYLLNGRGGTLIDKFQASLPVQGGPVVGDIDGDGKQEAVFKNVGWNLWAIQDNR